MGKGNNILMQTLLNSAMPMVERLVGSGKIDEMLRQLKESFRDRVPDGCSCEILVSSEADGCEYLNIVSMSAEMKIEGVLYQQKLSDAIVELIKKAKTCQ